MAGVMMEGDEGMEVKMGSQPSIDMDDTGMTAPVVESAHLTDGNRAEGVSYDENPGATGPDGSGFPPETDVGEANNPLKP